MDLTYVAPLAVRFQNLVKLLNELREQAAKESPSPIRTLRSIEAISRRLDLWASQLIGDIQRRNF